MNRHETELVKQSIAVILTRVDDLVELGRTLPDAKAEALRGYTFTGNTMPFKSVISNAINVARLDDLSPEANRTVHDQIYTGWRQVNNRPDTGWSRFRFWFWFKLGI